MLTAIQLFFMVMFLLFLIMDESNDMNLNSPAALVGFEVMSLGQSSRLLDAS